MTRKKEPKKIASYKFSVDEKAVLGFLYKERELLINHPAVQQLGMLEGQIQKHLSEIRKEKKLSKQLQWVDNDNLTGIYPTQNEAQLAGKKK